MEYLYQNCTWEREGLVTIPVMSADAKSSCWLYSSSDEPEVVVLGNLQVCPDARKEGRGKDILRFCEDVARKNGYERIQLKAECGSWMMKWYRREGFEVYCIDEDKPEMYVWLEKSLS